MFSKLACSALAAWVTCICFASVAHAQAPSFTYGKYEEVKQVQYVANASVGLLLATGNANQLSFSAAGMALRNDGRNKLQLDAGGAYAKSTVLVANDANGNGLIDNSSEISHQTNASTELWNAKLRYDRFFSPNNLGYVAGFAWGNTPAGKRVVAGGQVGYARQLFKNDLHLLQVEIGDDFSYERLVASVANYKLDSLRLFASYTLTASKDTQLLFSVEYLGNFNPYYGPYDVAGSSDKKKISSFGDSRVNGVASLTTRIWKKLAFRFQFTAHFDNVPAPLPTIGGLKFAPGFIPPAQTVDTLTEASLVVSFL